MVHFCKCGYSFIDKETFFIMSIKDDIFLYVVVLGFDKEKKSEVIIQDLI